MSPQAGDGFKIKAIREVIQDYSKSVQIQIYDFAGERGCTYKIDKNLSDATIKEIANTIDAEASRLGFKVAQIV